MVHNGRHITIAHEGHAKHGDRPLTGAEREGERLKRVLREVLGMELGAVRVSGTGPLTIDGISYQLGTSKGEDALVAGARCPHCGNMRYRTVATAAAVGMFVSDVQTGRECPSCAGGRR